jgi:hypothetical protein
MHIERSFAHILDAGGHETHNTTGMGESQQTLQTGGGLLQSKPTDAVPVWLWNAQATGSGYGAGRQDSSLPMGRHFNPHSSRSSSAHVSLPVYPA